MVGQHGLRPLDSPYQTKWRRAMLALEQSTYLGPATVLAVAGDRVKVELPDEHAWARLALGLPYQPAAGDEVLAVGRAGAWYVIGVLTGRGPTVLTAPADLE